MKNKLQLFLIMLIGLYGLSSGQCSPQNGCFNMKDTIVSYCGEGTFMPSSITYGNNEDYTMTFNADSSQQLLFEFSILDIKEGDHLKVYDGNSTAAPLLYDINENTDVGSLEFVSTSSSITFHFTSDSSLFLINGKWEATFNCVNPLTISDTGTHIGCDFILNTITNNGYSANQNKSYTFSTGLMEKGLQIDFLSNDSIMNYNDDLGEGDTIFVYRQAINNPNDKELLVARTNLSPDWNSLSTYCGDNLIIEFKSDNTDEGKGFLAKITCNDECIPNGLYDWEPSDFCSEASRINITNTYSGSTTNQNMDTNGYTIDIPGDFCDVCSLFIGSIENNAWMKFLAQDDTLEMNVYVQNCFGANAAIQMGIYKAQNCNNFELVSDAALTQEGVMAAGGFYTIIVPNLEVGQEYYIMVDGFAGEVCDYTFDILKGPYSGATVLESQTICPNTDATITIENLPDYDSISVQWVTENGILTTANPTITVSPDSTFTYEFTVLVEYNGYSVEENLQTTIFVSDDSVNCQPVFDVSLSASENTIFINDSVELFADISNPNMDSILVTWWSNPIDTTLNTTPTFYQPNDVLMGLSQKVYPIVNTMYYIEIENGYETSIDSVYVYVENDPNSFNVVANPTTDFCGSCVGSIGLDFVNGTPPYTITLNDTATFIHNSNAEYNINDLCTGIYDLKVIDANTNNYQTLVTISNTSFTMNPTYIFDSNDSDSMTVIVDLDLDNNTQYNTVIDWGDGTTTTNELNHTYNSIGTFLVNISVSDINDYCSNQDSLYIQINGNTPVCNANFIYELDTTPNCTYCYNFINQSNYNASSSSNTEFLWQLNDNNTYTDMHVLGYDFINSGQYEVCLTMTTTDNSGNILCTDEYCEYITVGSVNYYNIGGQIFAGTYPIETGMVDLYKTYTNSMMPIDSAYIDSSGIYYFYQIMEGEYIIKAKALDNNQYTYIPTYYGDQMYWQDAQHIIVNANNFDYDIHLLESDTPIAGDGSISGNIEADGNKDAFNGDVDNIEILLLDELNNPLAYTYSDANGDFSFNNLAEGTYIIYAECAYKYTMPVTVTIDANNQNVNGVQLTISNEDITGVVNYSQSEAVFNNPYPNPATNIVYLPISLIKKSSVNITIINSTGQIVKNNSISLAEGKYIVPMQINDLANGVYHVNIEINNQAPIIKRFIK